MGHDIYAWKRQYECDEVREAKFQEIVGDAQGDEWLKRYDRYQNEVQVSYFRRSTRYYSGPHGELLYKVLEAEDCSGGVSGYGVERRFGREQIGRALVQLRRMAQEDPVDDEDEPSVADELAFITDCADYIVNNGVPDVLIYFG